MRKLVAISAVVFFAFFLGCKEKSPEEKGKEALKAAAEKVPDSPEKVVNEAVKAVQEGNLVLVYAMLPDSYQKDLQAMYDKIAQKVDAEMYNKAWSVVEQAVAAVKKNKDKLGEGAPVPPEMLNKGIESADKFLAMAKEMKLNDAEAMKKLNIAAFLSDNGKKLVEYGWTTAETFDKGKVEEAKKMMGGMKAELKGEAGEKEATVILINGEEKEEATFVKVEGKWIPKDLADNWPMFKEMANKQIDEGLAQLEKNKEQINKVLATAEEAIKKFADSGKMDDLGPLMGAMQGM